MRREWEERGREEGRKRGSLGERRNRKRRRRKAALPCAGEGLESGLVGTRMSKEMG